MTKSGSVVEIRHEGRRWQLDDGDRLRFGRGADCDIRIGYEPDDRWVSRNAGCVIVSDRTWVVHNQSSHAQHILQPRPGEPVPLGPGQRVGLPHEYVQLRILGANGRHYEIVIDSRPQATAGDVAPPSRGARTHGPPEIRGAELRVLAALCEPLLRLAGPDARAATHPEVAERLGVGRGFVTRTVADLRDRLIREGIAEMVADSEISQTDSARLAGWAVRYGVVNEDVLRDLDRDRRRTP